MYEQFSDMESGSDDEKDKSSPGKSPKNLDINPVID